MLRAFFVLACLLFVSAQDTTSPCIPTTSVTSFYTCDGSVDNPIPLSLSAWKVFAIPASTTFCFNFTVVSPEPDTDIFVMALKPGSDSDGAYDQVQANVFDSTGSAFGCAAIQTGQTNNEMDFHCYPSNSFGGTEGFITNTNRNTTSSATLEIYADFVEGTVNTCAASDIEGGSSNYLLWLVGIVVVIVVVVVVILVAVGGVMLYKKKKRASDYDIYENAGYDAAYE